MTTADDVIEQCRELIGRPLGLAAERWKAEHPGGRAVAVYPVWAPAEVIHAAGMLPLALLGGGSAVELTSADARFQSFVCSIAKSTLELGFQGLVAGIDGFVFSNICDVARNLGSIYGRNFPEAMVEYRTFHRIPPRRRWLPMRPASSGVWPPASRWRSGYG